MPLADGNSTSVHFTDGAVLLPEWQIKLLPRGTKFVDLPYQEWVTKVANQTFVTVPFRNAIGEMLERHFQRP